MTRFLLSGAAALTFALPAFAEITIDDAYARSARPGAPTGAAFMTILNSSAEDDRLIDATSDIADRVELHTHKETGDGIMKMMEVEEGFVIPAGGGHTLARGGDHVMFMGLSQPLEQGATVTVTLVFEQAGAVTLEIPVDLERKPKHQRHGHGEGHAEGHGQGHGDDSKTHDH